MANFFYYDANGQKFGPVNDSQLKALAARGIIVPQTPLETDTGHKGKAGQIKGLQFPELTLMGKQENPFNNNIQESSVGIGRIIVLISVALGVVSYFLPWERLSGMNAFQGYQYLLRNEKGDSSDFLLGIAFLVFIYPLFMAVIKKSLILFDQIGGFVSGIAGIVIGINVIVNCDAGALGNAAGAGVYVFIIACVGLIVGTALCDRRLPNVIGKSRTDAALLAILFGPLGTHKFYMGSWGWGLVFIGFSLLLLSKGILITCILSLAQGIQYLVWTDDDFAAKYPAETQSPFR